MGCRSSVCVPGLLSVITILPLGSISTSSNRKSDLVHIQSYHTLVAPLAMLAARRAKLPYLLTFHGGGHSSQLRNATRGSQLALLRPLLAHAERLVTLAHFEETYFR